MGKKEKQKEKRKKLLRKRRKKCAVYAVISALALCAGVYLMPRPAGIVLLGVGVAALLLSINALARFMGKFLQWIVAAVPVALSVGAVFMMYSLIGGRFYPLDTAALDLTGQTGIDGIGRLDALETVVLRDMGLTDASPLADCSALKTADLRGNPLTLEAEVALAQALPNCRFQWEVPLPSGTVDGDVTAISLTGADVRQTTDVDNILLLLPDVETVDLGKVEWTLSDLSELEAAHPDVTFRWSVWICGGWVSNEDTLLTVTESTSNEVIASMLAMLPCVNTLDVSFEEYDIDTLMDLSDRLPDVKLIWKGRVSGMACSSSDTVLNLTGRGTQGEVVLWLAAHMPNVREIVATGLGLSDEILSEIAAQCPRVSVTGN